MRALSLIFAGLLLASPARAQDPFQLDDDEPGFGTDRPAPQPQAPRPELDDPDPDIEHVDDPTQRDDLLGDDPEGNRPLGDDTAEQYRKTIERVASMDPDDEMQVWDQYLRRYPNTAFRAQIEARMSKLEDALYSGGPIRPRDPDAPVVDADRAELKFSQALLLENINPRRRLQVLFEYGLPDYANLGLDYEHPFARNFSVHGGFRRRFTGLNFEGGARWALVKSARTTTLVTAIADVRMNASPAYFAFRPQLAAGKRFGKADLQAQVGVDLAPRALFEVRVIGGVSATYRASDAVALFAETSLFMKTISGDKGPYRFNQLTFGMKFFPNRNAKDPDATEVNLGASVPYSSAYWQYHYGSLMGQANLYLE